IRVLVTRLKTLKNEEVTVPNALILNGEVTNYSALSREAGLVLRVTVSIGYDVPWRQVEAMLVQAAKATTGVLQTPEPYVLQRELGATAVL
ncbi:MAG TPA: mechanosensitive ion channel domain-containing protein, partial [Myxococcaceae bacterium]|nr:mechanosensitive ion channel domain-containing protein [Myxococcaceae bacterium]